MPLDKWSLNHKIQQMGHDLVIENENIDIIGFEEINKDSGHSLEIDTKYLNDINKYKEKHFSYILSGSKSPNSYKDAKNTL
jgi:hypothetical protein